MANIEERAKELYPDAFDDDEIVPAREGYIVKVQRLAYIEGATAQKQIDDEDNGNALLYAVHKTEERTKREMIEKACKWIKRELADPMPDELYQQWCDDKLAEFRKAMEE